MSDIIRLLPDHVANQIAAGEVVQRPSSVVKELLENSIDAGSTSISLVIKDAGRTLIQVIDNGCGMSDSDARMCFERHATSKIADINDLFKLRTKGFRGEAMASIAAIAQVELKTKLHDTELGTLLSIEGNKVKDQKPIQCNSGAVISVKNLFYNVPARRNFLKSNKVELKHIIDEFERVALTHADISFKLVSNENELFNLPASGLRQRIVQIFGKNFNEKIVPVAEKTSIVNISGFIGKPEYAKKVRGEQFLFLNQRFVKNNYLHHAVMNAYEELIHHKSHPAYFLYLEIAPDAIDINIHPTKTEVKFEDQKAVYAIVNAAVKQGIGKFQMSPTLDFSKENSFELLETPTDITPPEIKVNPEYNPFKGTEQKEKPYTTSSYSNISNKDKEQFSALNKMYQDTSNIEFSDFYENKNQTEIEEASFRDDTFFAFQYRKKFIVTRSKKDLILIHQNRAHQRILYENIIKNLSLNKPASQKKLFPEQITFNPKDYAIIQELWDDIKKIGFDIDVFGNNTIVVNGIPTTANNIDIEKAFQELIENYHNTDNHNNFERQKSIAKSMAKSMALKSNVILNLDEMKLLVDKLYGCESPLYSPYGLPIVLTLNNEIDKFFK